MSKNEKDYSDYIQHLSNITNGLYFFAGFTFSSIAILLTQLPNPDSIISQFTLFFLALLFYMLVFLARLNTTHVIHFCKDVPPLSKRVYMFNVLMLLSIIMSGIAVVLMFLLWNLVYLVLASGIVCTFFIISVFSFIVKPFLETRKTLSQSGNQNIYHIHNGNTAGSHSLQKNMNIKQDEAEH